MTVLAVPSRPRLPATQTARRSALSKSLRLMRTRRTNKISDCSHTDAITWFAATIFAPAVFDETMMQYNSHRPVAIALTIHESRLTYNKENRSELAAIEKPNQYLQVVDKLQAIRSSDWALSEGILFNHFRDSLNLPIYVAFQCLNKPVRQSTS